MPAALARIPGLTVVWDAPLRQYTRFGVGGPARLLVDVPEESLLAETLAGLREDGQPTVVIGGGSNLVVSDAGFPGAVLRYTESSILVDGTHITVGAGAALQTLVDASIAHGLRGMETMTGIPGWVGGALYGNAGAYGHSIHERVESVRFFDGSCLREIGPAECGFRYRESVFKQRKDWILVSARLSFFEGDPAELARTAAGILQIRNEKYPPTMKCAGSIFKNLILAELETALQARVPSGVIREGKVPGAWFLEQVGAKGMKRGGIEVATYHANLIYNTGTGTAAEVKEIIGELKARVAAGFGLQLEEEVQYVGY